MKEGAINTMLEVSKSGWDIYLKWFEFFINNIYLLLGPFSFSKTDGSDVSIQLIEKARTNDIHLLCFPAHTTHLLEPLDVGLFKLFKIKRVRSIILCEIILVR